jgi:hypothetical protein
MEHSSVPPAGKSVGCTSYVFVVQRDLTQTPEVVRSSVLDKPICPATITPGLKLFAVAGIVTEPPNGRFDMRCLFFHRLLAK